MKSQTTLQYIACAVIATLAFCSCQKEPGRFRTGEEVRFTAGSGSAETKAAYSGQTNADGTIERIDWQVNDLLHIYCAQAIEPVLYADYKVTSVESTISGSEELSRAHIELSDPNSIGLRWGTGSHTFYAAYPSPATTGGITTSISGNEVSANLPAVQSIVGDITRTGSAWVAEPDLKNMLMTAKTTCTEATMPDENTVFLSFTPLTTAVQFTIKNDTGAQMDLTSVQLISGNGKSTAEPVINGAFSVDLDQTGIASGTVVTPYSGLNITYNRAYPLCTGTATTSTDMSDRTVTINVGTATDPLSLAVNETFTFTFFLNPIHDFNDLTFKLTKSDDSWMSTRLGYTDGTGIFFPRHKKSFVTGLLVPEGAQWTIRYNPDVVSWNAGGNSTINPMPEVNEDITLVTSWDTGVEKDLELTPVTPPDVLPEAFSVNPVHKVYFSSANLYFDHNYVGKFEDNQYDYRTYEGKNSCINGVVTTNGTPSGHWGLFGWSCEGVYYGTSVSMTNSNYSGEFLNWGKIFGTSDWRTLSKDEWYYMLFTRTVNGGTGEGKSYKQTTVTLENAATVQGFMIAPDSYTSDLTATYTWEAYQAAESAGCMFLPFAGVRNGENVSSGNMCFYWSSDRHDEDTAYAIVFESAPGIGADVYLYRGCSVRLVKDAN